MLYNKNNVRKTNDKKILHKVGKQWKVVSVALLMAIGGGAVATHVANAQSNNTNNNSALEVSEAAAEATPSAVSAAPASSANNSAKSNTASSASSKINAFKPVSVASNDPAFSAKEHGVTAASYKNKASNDKAVINDYVQSLNAKLPATAINIANETMASAKSAENSDNAMANHYSAVAKSNVNSPAVKSLASKSGLTPSDYANVVAVDADNYNANVKNASAFENAFNMVSSLANNLVMNNWNSASNVAASKANDLNAKSQVAADTSNAFSSANASASSSANSASTANNIALSEATNASIKASVATDVAKGLVGTAVNGINDVAKSLGVNVADVNSAVASYAAKNSSYASYSVDNKSANSASESAEMSFAVSNSYNMSSAASVTASANSTIASAKAHSAVYSANVVSASAASVKASKVNSAASDAYLVAKIASAATSTINANMTSNSASDAAFIQSLANAYHNGGRASLASKLNISAADMDKVESNSDDKLMLASMASAEGVNVLALKNNEPAVKSVLSAGSAAVSSASASNNHKALNLSDLQSLANSMSASASTVTSNAQSASASYASANDTDVTLASYYASSYANDASEEANSVSTIASGLAAYGNKYGLNTSAYASAVADLGNAEGLANAYAQGAYNNAPKYVTVEKQVALYNVANGKYSWVVNVPAGTRLTVNAVSIAKNGQLRYVTSYKGKTGSVNSYPSYVKQTYLNSQANVNVKVTNKSAIYTSTAFGKSATGHYLNAGTKLSGVNIVMPAGQKYGAFTAVQLNSGKFAGDFVSANIAYAEVENNNSNNNSSVTPASQAPTYYFD